MRREADPAEVADTIRYLTAMSNERFTEALADYVMDPPEDAPFDAETEAFRSKELLARSLAACQYLIEHVQSVIRTRDGADEPAVMRKKRMRFRAKVEFQSRIMRSIQRERDYVRNLETNAPSPRGRALRRLKQRHLAEYQELVREETEKDAEKKREARRAARARKRARDRVENPGRR